MRAQETFTVGNPLVLSEQSGGDGRALEEELSHFILCNGLSGLWVHNLGVEVGEETEGRRVGGSKVDASKRLVHESVHHCGALEHFVHILSDPLGDPVGEEEVLEGGELVRFEGREGGEEGRGQGDECGLEEGDVLQKVVSVDGREDDDGRALVERPIHEKLDSVYCRVGHGDEEDVI